MCGRYAVTLPPEAMRAIFKTLNLIEYPPRYNIAPTQPIIAIWQKGEGRQAVLVRWGYVPVWVKDPRDFPLIINARAESLLEKPAFRGAMRHNRCIIPASGYYEWQKGADGTKTPYYITRTNGAPMAFAGLHSTWMGPEGEEVDTAAIVTVAAGPDTRHIHDRTPAVLGNDEEMETWLDTRAGNETGAKAARQLVLPLPEGSLAFHPVSTRVNAVKNDDPGLIEPASAEKPDPESAHKKTASGQMDLF